MGSAFPTIDDSSFTSCTVVGEKPRFPAKALKLRLHENATQGSRYPDQIAPTCGRYFRSFPKSSGPGCVSCLNFKPSQKTPDFKNFTHVNFPVLHKHDAKHSTHEKVLEMATKRNQTPTLIAASQTAVHVMITEFILPELLALASCRISLQAVAFCNKNHILWVTTRQEKENGRTRTMEPRTD